MRGKNRRSGKTNPMALYAALGKVRGFDEREKSAIIIPVRLSFDNLKNNCFNANDICNLYTAVCIALRCAGLIEGRVHQSCLDAKSHILYLHDWFLSSLSRALLSVQELEAVLVGVEVFEAVVDVITPNQMVNIIRKLDVEIKKWKRNFIYRRPFQHS